MPPEDTRYEENLRGDLQTTVCPNHVDRRYQRYLRTILTEGTSSKDRTGTGTKKVMGRQIRFDLSEGFPLLTVRPVWPKGVFRELLWFLRGRTNIWHLLQDDVGIWTPNAYANYREVVEGTPMEGDIDSQKEFEAAIKKQDNPEQLPDGPFANFASLWGEMGEIYGKRWRDADGFDQIENLIDQIETNPDSRRLKVDAWRPDVHMQGAPDTNEAVLPPCHTGFQVTTKELTTRERSRWAKRKGNQVSMVSTMNERTAHKAYDRRGVPDRKLSLRWTQRSVDSMIGLPFNIASYAALTHLLADQTNMAVGDLVFQGGDCHIYANHLEAAGEIVDRPGKPTLPELSLPEVSPSAIDDYSADAMEIQGYDPHPKGDLGLPIAT